jgi:hypothetical protein
MTFSGVLGDIDSLPAAKFASVSTYDVSNEQSPAVPKWP